MDIETSIQKENFEKEDMNIEELRKHVQELSDGMEKLSEDMEKLKRFVSRSITGFEMYIE